MQRSLHHIAWDYCHLLTQARLRNTLLRHRGNRREVEHGRAQLATRGSNGEGEATSPSADVQEVAMGSKIIAPD